MQKLARHWPEYLMEGILLGLFMLSACFFTALIEYPGSPLASPPWSPLTRRVLIGAGMGLTAVLLIYSPWGRRSGAHMNPSVTLTFWRLGKVSNWDASFYILAQFVGGTAGVLLAAATFHSVMANPTVEFVVTKPGSHGVAAAFVAEMAITFLLMWVILAVSNSSRFAHLTGLCAGLLITAYVSFEAPLSGMSMNPARTFASAIAAGDWTAIWVYFTAPVLGMLLAAEIYTRANGVGAVWCAKLHHRSGDPCIFCEHHKAG
jgi:aquaporin Z